MRIGDAVSDFTLPDDAGQAWTLSEHGGSTVLLIFHRHLM
jgi:peroxiredoxin